VRWPLAATEPAGGQPTRAAVILPFEKPSRVAIGDASGQRAAEARLAEAVGLAASIGVAVVHSAVYPLREKRPATLMGEGQVEMTGRALKQQEVGVVVVDAALTPVAAAQSGEGLGLQGHRPHRPEPLIFGERAHHGKARCRSSSPIWNTSERGWCGLDPSRTQRGGFGFLGRAPAHPRSRSTGG